FGAIERDRHRRVAYGWIDRCGGGDGGAEPAGHGERGKCEVRVRHRLRVRQRDRCRSTRVVCQWANECGGASAVNRADAEEKGAVQIDADEWNGWRGDRQPERDTRDGPGA